MKTLHHKIQRAVLDCVSVEALVILGRHVQRENGTGIFHFLPGHTQQTLSSDLQVLAQALVDHLKTVQLLHRITETDKAGVEVNWTIHAHIPPQAVPPTP